MEIAGEFEETKKSVLPSGIQVVLGFFSGMIGAAGIFSLSPETGEDLAEMSLKYDNVLIIKLFIAFAFTAAALIVYQFFSRRKTRYRWLLVGMRIGFLLWASVSIYVSLLVHSYIPY